MDQLMDAGKAKSEEIMADFPSSLSCPSLTDHAALSKLYLNARSQATLVPGHNALHTQLAILENHVKICIELWKLIRSRRLPRGVDMGERYRQGLAQLTVRTSPRKHYDSPSSGKAKAAETESDLVMLTQMRHLAELWHHRVTTRDVPVFCHFADEGSLRKMKISCAADLTSSKWRREVIFP